MIKFDNQSHKMTCKEVQLLMVSMWADGWGVTDKQRAAFEAHLVECSTCAQEYEETRQIMSLTKEHWGPISEDTRELIEQSGYPIQEQNSHRWSRKHEMKTEDSWQDLLYRCPDLAEGPKIAETHAIHPSERCSCCQCE